MTTPDNIPQWAIEAAKAQHPELLTGLSDDLSDLLNVARIIAEAYAKHAPSVNIDWQAVGGVTTKPISPTEPSISPLPAQSDGSPQGNSGEAVSVGDSPAQPSDHLVQLDEDRKNQEAERMAGIQSLARSAPREQGYSGFVRVEPKDEAPATGDTPRVDAEASPKKVYDGGFQIVPAPFARQLERELNAAKAELHIRNTELKGVCAKRDTLRAENAELRKDKKRLESIRAILDDAREINILNYNEDELVAINAALIDIHRAAIDAARKEDKP